MMAMVSENVRSFSICALFVCGFVLCATAAVDRTLEEDAVRRDVVDSTVEKIHASGIFPDDHEFLRRLAYVTTRDRGSQSIKPPDDNFGGLWNVTFDLYNKTLVPALALQHEQIQDYFNISWANTTWHDLRTPLYSGLAARLYIHSILPEVPVAIMDQASMWEYFYYKPSYWSTYTYVNLSQEYEASVLSYGTRLELLILIDNSGSSSATPENFEVYKNHLSKFVQLFPVLTDYVHFGLISFNDQPEVVLPLYSYGDINDTLEAIASLKNPTGSANTNAALELARTVFLNGTDAAQTAFKAVITITEGNSATGVESIALLQDLGISTYAVGMYSNPNKDELLKLAGDDLTRVFSWTDSEQLDMSHRILHVAGTKVSHPFTLGMSAGSSLVKHELSYYKIDLPSEGITLSFQTTEGSVSGFYSATKEFPNSAIYDGQIDTQRGSFIEPISLGSEVVFVAIEGDQFRNTFGMKILEGNQVGSSAGRGMNSGFFTIISTFVVALIAANLN